MKKIIVTGCTGTLGSELIVQLKKVFPPYNIIEFTHDKVDCANYEQVKNAIREEHNQSKVSYVINCAALVNTVGIENSFETKNSSFKSNALIPKYLAEICKEYGIKLIHISTDYVFSEYSTQSIDGKYDEFPINLYGYHKLLGEMYVERYLDSSQFSTLRVGWIYGHQTKRTFIHKFIKNVVNLMNANSASSCEVSVVCDQVSTPTSVKFISDGICRLVKDDKMVGTSALCPLDTVSKYDYAIEILNNIKRIYNINIFENVKVSKSFTQQKDIGYPKDSRLQKLSSAVVSTDISWKQDLHDYMTIYKNEFIEFINDLI